MKKLAVIVGRFQTYSIEEHLGYSQILIAESLKIAEKILFIIGCQQIVDSCIITCDDDFENLLGVNKKNPLNYDSRRIMILQYFSSHNLSSRLSDITFIHDLNSDILWSNNLDQIIKNNSAMIENNEIILVGSRDSFIKSYRGIFETKNLISEIIFSSTQMRESIEPNFENKSFQIGFIASQKLMLFSKVILPDEDSRKGFIYGIINKDKFKIKGNV